MTSQITCGYVSHAEILVADATKLAIYISIKLGIITPEGGAGALSIAVACVRFIEHPDIYGYACDDARQDPEIAAQLKTFGINIQSLAKTEKSMTEPVRFCS